MKIPSSNLRRTCCVQKLFLTFRTIFVHNMFSPCSEKEELLKKFYLYVCISNHDFLTLRRFEWISLRNGDFKFEKTFFKWRVRWTFQRSFKFINVGLIFAPKWLSRIGTLRREKNHNFLNNLDVTLHLTFSILLSSVFKRATRAIFEKFMNLVWLVL